MFLSNSVFDALVLRNIMSIRIVLEPLYLVLQFFPGMRPCSYGLGSATIRATSQVILNTNALPEGSNFITTVSAESMSVKIQANNRDIDMESSSAQLLVLHAKCESTNQEDMRDVGTCQKGILRSCTAHASSFSDRSLVVSMCC